VHYALAALRKRAEPQPCSWQQTFPASADQVRQARRYLAHLMSDSPIAADAVLCLSELATNSVVHSDSGRSGGSFTVRVTCTPDQWRVSVGDDGGPWREQENGDSQHNRGLAIVAALSSRWQIGGDGMSGRIVSFELDHDRPPGTQPRRESE
jgi:serine/threonine-protein kinase RsbW